MNEATEYKKPKAGLGVGTRRVIAYIVLIILSFLCLFGFYILLINSTRSNSNLGRGFQILPSNYFAKNFKGMFCCFFRLLITTVLSCLTPYLLRH